jgi:hypothetical protein
LVNVLLAAQQFSIDTLTSTAPIDPESYIITQIVIFMHRSTALSHLVLGTHLFEPCRTLSGSLEERRVLYCIAIGKNSFAMHRLVQAAATDGSSASWCGVATPSVPTFSSRALPYLRLN